MNDTPKPRAARVVVLPCPFCGVRPTNRNGGSYTRTDWDGGSTRRVRCVTCDVRPMGLASWNKRACSPEISKLEAKILRLERELTDALVML